MSIFIVVVVVLVAAGFVSCKFIRGQILDGPGMERDTTQILEQKQDTVASIAQVQDTQDTAAAQAFVEKFYKEWVGEDVLNYDYPKQHITPALLQYLADAYEFDCEGECLATWKFFYEGGGDEVNGSHARSHLATRAMSLLRSSMTTTSMTCS